MNQNQNRNKLIAQIGTALIAVLLCLCSVIVYWNDFAGNKDDIAYPLEKGVNNYDPYVQQFDAFMKGQANIDFEADPRLETLENVYDYSERAKSGIYYLWDRAYFEGKYYSYFGLTPVLTVIYPYFQIHGAIPGSGRIMAVFAAISAIFMPLMLFAWAWFFAPKLPHWFVLFGSVALFWGSLIMLIVRGHTPFYYIACASALAYFSVFIFLAIMAYGMKKRVAGIVLYAFAGIAYGLLFQSRTITAVAAAILVLPGLWFFIIGKKREETRKKRVLAVIYELAALGIPVIAIVCASLYFNYIRFGSFFDFGNNYNLTVADVNTYRLRLSDFPFALFHYHFDTVSASDVYPYISFSYVKFSDYGHYVYKDASLGMMNIPLAFGMLASPAVIFNNKFSASRRIFTAAALLAVIIVPWMDFGLGGIIYRYTSDFSLIDVLFSVIVFSSLCELLLDMTDRNAKIASYVLMAAICCFFVFSIVMSIRVSLINGNGNVVKFNDETCVKTAQYFNFKPVE